MILPLRTSSAFALLATVTLLGAGCAKSDSSPSPTVPTQPATTTNTGSPAPSDASSITASSTLDTSGWQSYQNKTLKFSFLSPIKGAFAPQYGVKLLPLTSKDVQNDCAVSSSPSNATEQRLTVNGSPFCRTVTLESAAGSTSSQEAWVTKTDKWYAVITFTKKNVTDREGYKRQIEMIMSTFQFPANPS